MLKIWGRLSSVNVQKVVWCADELGLRYERLDAGGAFGIVKTPAYLAKNPNGLIPVIEDGSFVLWESNAIVRYLASRYGEDKLWPRDATTRANADRWMDWQAVSFNPAMGPAFVQLIRTAPEQRDAGVIEAARAATEQKLALLDEHLSQHRYVAGNAFTMGDIPLGCSVDRWMKLPIARRPHPHVERWYGALRTRGDARQVMNGTIS
jgi:glutathione S-transferase